MCRIGRKAVDEFKECDYGERLHRDGGAEADQNCVQF